MQATPTSKATIEALGNALDGALLQPTHIYEHYAQLIDNAKFLAISLSVQQIAQTQRRQLHLASRILRYSLLLPTPRPTPVDIYAFLWEWLANAPRQTQLAAPSESTAKFVLCDQALLQPLLHEYAYQTQSIGTAPLQVVIEMNQQHTLACSATLFANDSAPPHFDAFIPANAWLNSASQPNELLQHEAYALCISYAALLENVHPIHFATLGDSQRLAIRMTFALAECVL